MVICLLNSFLSPDQSVLSASTSAVVFPSVERWPRSFERAVSVRFLKDRHGAVVYRDAGFAGRKTGGQVSNQWNRALFLRSPFLRS